jgi:hypothetical protein
MTDARVAVSQMLVAKRLGGVQIEEVERLTVVRHPKVPDPVVL